MGEHFSGLLTYVETTKQPPALSPPEPYAGQLEFIEGLRKVINARRRYNLLLYDNEDPSVSRRPTKASGDEYFAELEARDQDLDRAKESHEARWLENRRCGIVLPMDELAAEHELDGYDRRLLEALLVECTALGENEKYRRLTCGLVARSAADWEPDKVQGFLPHLLPKARLTRAGLIHTMQVGPVSCWSLNMEPETLVRLVDAPAQVAESEPTRIPLPRDIIACLRDHGVELTAAAAEGIRGMWGWLAHGDVVANEWGFGRSAHRSRSTCLLFHGPSGTGKTLTARVLSRALGKPLRLVTATEIMDKYVGETGKNLRAAFDEAAKVGALLLLDEADALLGRRGDVSRASERLFNADVNSALTELDRYRGLCVLTTNYPDLLDPAVLRRLRHKVFFGPPEPETRARIWQCHIPEKAPVAADVDFGKLGSDYELTGGQIANAVIAAAALAAARIGDANAEVKITMADLENSAAVEYRGCRPDETGKRAMGFGNG
jgi:Rad3-related DNA helicase